MANPHTTSAGSSHGSYKSYMIGFVLSVILTAIPFGLVMFPSMSKEATLWNVIAFVFSALIIAFLVGLSLWIMFSIHHFMMAK
jgi:cytochrome o ubiquinol oxidase operon protein cyoD